MSAFAQLAIAVAAGAAASGGNVVVQGTPVVGSSGSGTTNSASYSATAGRFLLVGVLWYNAVTISSITCSGETINVVGSAAGNGTNNQTGRSQWATITSVASTASKTVNVTFSASAAQSKVVIIELTGVTGVGAHPAAQTNTSTNPSGTITNTGGGSAIFAILMSSSSGATAPGGWTDIAVTDVWSFENMQYKILAAGSPGSQNINFTNAGAADWHIDAIELLST